MPTPAPPDPTAPAHEAELLGTAARQLGLALTPEQCARMLDYMQRLQRWNRTHNLTSITRRDQMLSHHLLDSLSLAVELPPAPALSVLDAGSGAGLPGLPLAIALPQHRFTLVDAVGKKCAFALQACLHLRIGNAQVLHARLEQMRGQRFDVIMSRALGSLADLVELTQHLLAPGGRWIAMKGRRPDAEMAALPPGVSACRVVTLRVPLLDEARHLVILNGAPAGNESDS